MGILGFRNLSLKKMWPSHHIYNTFLLTLKAEQNNLSSTLTALVLIAEVPRTTVDQSRDFQ